MRKCHVSLTINSINVRHHKYLHRFKYDVISSFILNIESIIANIMFLVLILSIFSFVYTTDIQTSCNIQFITENLLKSTFDVRTILCDIDGTLLANHKFSDVSFNAIKETIQVKGYPFFPCTG